MFLEKLEISSTKIESLPPDENKAAEIFSRIGYRIEEALADLVDNSIDARAKNVLIRFVRYPEGIHSVVIADDGHGMDDATLFEAMRFGSKTIKDESALGKYGIGLKSASLSQAKTVTVISKKDGKTVGRRWTTENIKLGWKCELLKPIGCEALLSSDMGPVNLLKSGTVVIWERLEHLKATAPTVDRMLEKAAKVVATELGIKFHRFLENGRPAIFLDTLELTEDVAGIAVPVLPLDPFSYEASGSHQYPQDIHLSLSGNQHLILKCHIWPPKTKAPGYRLGGGKVASRQGFYFYRNNRLIQAGGWNGVQADDGEPHMSLARVEIDLPPGLESLFQLNIGKSLIDPPPQFQALLDSSAAEGTLFRKYLRDADATYRRQKKKESSKFPFVPGKGFPRPLQKTVTSAFMELGASKPKEIDFAWKTLGPGEVFELDTQTQSIALNKRYRDDIVAGSKSDGAVVKLLLLLLVQENMGRSFMTERSKDWLRRVNQSLLASLGASS